MRSLLCLATVLVTVSPLAAQDKPSWAFENAKGVLTVRARDKSFAEYRHADPKIARPFFCSLHAPDGQQVTRNHPPIPGKDAADHDTFHPGLWLSFGDVSGADFWRNKAKVELEKFLHEPSVKADKAGFSVKLRLLSNDGTVLGWENDTFTFLDQPTGYLMIWAATFEPADRDLVFGDQEEMGLGVRLATPLTVKAGGTIRDSEGRVNEKAVWGKAAKWCAYYRSFDKDSRMEPLAPGVIQHHLGVALFPDPGNFRPSWWHARDYGLLVANPFGRNAFTRAAPSKVAVKKGESLTLRFGVFVFSQNGRAPEIEPAYQGFLKAIGGG